jgi:K+ transporter
LNDNCRSNDNKRQRRCVSPKKTRLPRAGYRFTRHHAAQIAGTPRIVGAVAILGRSIVVPTLGGGMAFWREKLFASMHRNAAAAADFLNLPTNRVVELGSKVET